MYFPFVGTPVSLVNYLNFKSCKRTMLVTSYYYTAHVYGDTFLRGLSGMCFSDFDFFVF